MNFKALFSLAFVLLALLSLRSTQGKTNNFFLFTVNCSRFKMLSKIFDYVYGQKIEYFQMKFMKSKFCYLEYGKATKPRKHCWPGDIQFCVYICENQNGQIVDKCVKINTGIPDCICKPRKQSNWNMRKRGNQNERCRFDEETTFVKTR